MHLFIYFILAHLALHIICSVKFYFWFNINKRDGLIERHGHHTQGYLKAAHTYRWCISGRCPLLLPCGIYVSEAGMSGKGSKVTRCCDIEMLALPLNASPLCVYRTANPRGIKKVILKPDGICILRPIFGRRHCGLWQGLTRMTSAFSPFHLTQRHTCTLCPCMCDN